MEDRLRWPATTAFFVLSHIVFSCWQRLAEIVENAVGVPLESIHHDISTVTGEELIVFSLADTPVFRPKKKV